MYPCAEGFFFFLTYIFSKPKASHFAVCVTFVLEKIGSRGVLSRLESCVIRHSAARTPWCDDRMAGGTLGAPQIPHLPQKLMRVIDATLVADIRARRMDSGRTLDVEKHGPSSAPSPTPLSPAPSNPGFPCHYK